jgi:glycosyltransferase involved in cell wall biosynthesis
MNILQITGNFYSGGAQKIVLNLSNELSKRGYNITLCVKGRGNLGPILDDVDVNIISRRGILDINALYKICRLIKKKNVDIVHGHLAGSSLYGIIAAKITGKKFVITIHGGGSLSKVKLLYLYKLISHFSDRVVVVSEQIRKEYSIKTRVRPDKIIIIENGIAGSKVKTLSNSLSKRKELNLTPDVSIIGTVGNISHVKGHDILINAFEKVVKAYRDARLVIVGDTIQKSDVKYKSILDKMVDSLNLKGKVLFLGARRDVEEILPLFDVFVLPSRNEGTSVALLEAMISGRPIIATKVGGNPGVIEHKVSGLLVTPDEPESLSKEILRLLNDKSFSSKLGDNAREVVEKRFMLKTMVDCHAKMYHEVIKNC